MIFVIRSIILFALITICKSFYNINRWDINSNIAIKKSRIVIRNQKDIVDFEAISNSFKIVEYGQKPNQNYGLESKDRKYYIMNKSIEVSRINGIGLDLVEGSNKGDGISGLVLISDIIQGSNADKVGSFLPGDALIRLSTKDKSIDITGLNYDQTVNALGAFSDYDSITITIQRLQLRKEIKVKVVGPQGEPVTEFDIYSGYGSNLRTALQSNNLKMYDDRTGRFDSPYQTGNCGGEGTCGTCLVAVLEGKELLNGKKLIEERALQRQICPPNYRWSCRVAMGPDPTKGGNVTIKLRPQTTVRDYKK